MIEHVRSNRVKPVVGQFHKQKPSIVTSNTDVLAPMKRFKKDLPIPKIGATANSSMQKVLINQKEFYSHRGQVYEQLRNPRAAIASYQKAAYYEPSDTNLSSQIIKLKVKSLTNLKA